MKCGKVCYSSQEFALQDVERINRISKRDKLPKRAYYCHACKAWHLSSRGDYKDLEILKLRNELQLLKEENSKLKNSVNNVIDKEIKTDKRVAKLSETIDKYVARVKSLREANKELINQIVVLENKLKNT
jgi:chromosome segregation ATPase